MPTRGHSAFTIVDDRQLHYLWWGRRDAPAVVCLHGGAQTAYMWETLGAALADRYFVFAPDLPGHGDSDVDLSVAGTTAGIDRRALADSVEQALDHIGIDTAAFVGASLGGITSLTIASQSPTRVSAIALVDIGHRLEDEGVKRIVEFMTKHESFASLEDAAVAVGEYLPNRSAPSSPDRLRRNLRQRADGRWEWKHALGRQLRDASARQGEGASGGEPSFEPGNWRALTAGMDAELAHIECPVLVLRGAKSDVLSDEGAQEATNLIPNARLATIGSAGHHAAGDNPETTVTLVSTFFSEVGW
ncbi:MAG: Chloride peroxidase [Actinomycetia bacterium]|nr:Chloride peroxidase [Actinomycetes bacterium]